MYNLKKSGGRGGNSGNKKVGTGASRGWKTKRYYKGTAGIAFCN